MQPCDDWPGPQAGVAGVVGAQLPRVRSVPPFAGSRGEEAIELAARAGLALDEWQRLVLADALGVDEEERWAAFEVGLDVARQNGKGAILEARELAGLFLFGEELLIHSAHNFSTSLEAFMRMENLLEATPDLSRQVRRVNRSNTEWGFRLFSGQRLQYRTRTKGGARGYSAPVIVFDEAMFLPEHAIGAMLPIVSAMANPQIWYTGSAVDQQVHDEGVVFARIRERGLKGGDPSLAFFEWSAGVDSLAELTQAQLDDEALAAQANPALGIRISLEHVANERRSMDWRTFAVERYGIGDWPATDGSSQHVIDLERWQQLTDGSSRLLDPVCFAFDVSPDRVWASIAAAGRREDGLAHVEVVERRKGTRWLPARLAQLCARHEAEEVICDAVGPAGSLLNELNELLEEEVVTVSAQEHARACGLLFDTVEERGLRHLGTAELESAIKGATKRPLGDAWAWSRKNSAVDISPLVACTLALFSAASKDLDGEDEYVLDPRATVTV